ncbi:MAG: hypothetical protein WC631_00970 [Candidatus Paceibacterota bacterium]|jgi:hypothetical protein
MKRALLYIWFISIIFLTREVFANTNQINAGILSSVWYSSININDQDLVKIFGAIQNHSDITFSGIASIFVDDELNSKVNFTSTKDSLLEISGPWKALEGRHSVQIKITEINGVSTSSLLSFESDRTSLSITKPITLEVVKENTQKIAENVVQKIDVVANALADKIETYKKPEVASQSVVASDPSTGQTATTKTNSEMVGQVLGAETKYQASSSGGLFKYPIVTNIYNKMIDFFSMIVRNWQITLFVIIILFIIIRYFII